MRRLTAITTVVAAIILLCTTGRLSAGIVAHEPFGPGYTTEANIDGQNPPVTGFQDPWASTTGVQRVTSAGLGYYNADQLLQSSGGSSQIILLSSYGNTNRIVTRAMDYDPDDTVGTFYASGIVAAPPPGTANSGGFAMVQLLDMVSDLPPGTFGLQFGVNQSEVRLRARSDTNVVNTDYTLAGSYTPNENLFFVIKAEQDVSQHYDRISVWLNPADFSSESAAGAPTGQFMTASLGQTAGSTLDNRNVDTFGFRSVNFSDTGTAAFDEFRFGSAWEDVTPYVDVTKIKASDDAHVASGSPGSNYGTHQVMELKNSMGNWHRKAYMRFDLSDVRQDSIRHAWLALTVTHDGGTLDANQTHPWVFSVYGLNDGDPGENWDSSAINWSNAPQNDTGDGEAMLANTTLLGSFTVAGSPTEQILLGKEELPGLADFFHASQDDLVTLIITRQTVGDPGGDIAMDTIHGIRSIDYDLAFGTDFAPTLLFSVPEPSALLLLALGGLGLLACWRRKR